MDVKSGAAGAFHKFFYSMGLGALHVWGEDAISWGFGGATIAGRRALLRERVGA